MNALDKKKELTDRLVRNEIYQAAVKVLEEHGLSGMTMERVAESAGVAKGTLYNYFKGKDDLFGFTHQKLFEDHWEHMEALRKKDLPIVQKLKATILSIFNHFSTNQKVMMAIHDGLGTIGGSREFMKIHVQRSTKVATLFVEMINTGIAEDIFRQMDVQFAGEMLISSIIGKIKRCTMNESPIEPERFTDTLMDIFLTGIEK